MSSGRLSATLGGVAVLLVMGLIAALVGVVTVGASTDACGDGGSGNQPPPSGDARTIPGTYLTLYRQAGEKYSIPWNVLAAVGKVESDHGRSNLPGIKSGQNAAGAGGPMQFLQPTWKQYGVDGDGDGDKDRYDPSDAIPGAANYLRASGAPANMRKALYAYNHAWWYVDKVLAQAARYGAGDYTTTPVSAAPCPGPGGFIVPPKGKGKNGGWLPESPGGPDGITPRTRRVRDLVKQLFSVRYTIGCLRPGDPLDHGKGRACDFMLSSGGVMPTAEEIQRGYDISNWAAANASELGIHYVIYRQRIWNIDPRAGLGWRLMGDRGSITQNHFDHVHISIY